MARIIRMEDEAESQVDETASKDALLLAMLPDVPFDGWTDAGLRAAARRIDVDEAELDALFPRGPRDMVAWFSHWADRQALEALSGRPLESMRVSERIAAGVLARLAALEPYREEVRRTLAFLALPTHVALGAKLLYDTVDALWYAAGDGSTDFSFYTKRGMLAGVYAATTLYWLDDRSADGADTEAFLARRLADIGMLPRLRARIRRGLDVLPNPARLWRVSRTRF